MANVAAMQASAREIAERALAQTRADDGASLSLSEAIAVLHAHADEARRTRTGRELTLFEAHPEKVGRLIDELIAGNYRDTAATLAGMTSRSVRGWMDAADKGDARYRCDCTGNPDRRGARRSGLRAECPGRRKGPAVLGRRHDVSRAPVSRQMGASLRGRQPAEDHRPGGSRHRRGQGGCPRDLDPGRSGAMMDAPTDDGVKLATITRGGDRELRIRFRDFKGHAFIDVREWAASPQTGEWWPVKGKGATIKPHELEAVIAGLQTARKTDHDRATSGVRAQTHVDHLSTNSR